MTIYRGPGGTGDATSDSDTTEFQQFLIQTVAAKDAAIVAETAAETAASAASGSASSAATSATAAASGANAANTSATNAASSATNAASSATAAAASAASVNDTNLVHKTGNETIGGIKTFISSITGSVTGTSANVTGTVAVINGGTGSTTVPSARTALGVAIGTDVQEYSANLTAYASTGIGFRNRIINGDMRIDQRNAGAAVTVNTTTNTYGVDRFFGAGQSAAGVFTTQRSTVAPAGFINSTVVTVTTADASLAASGRTYGFGQNIEGFNISDLGWGAAGASSVTISFWIQSSVTGSYSATLFNLVYGAGYVASFTINSANTWEYKTITIPGSTSGSWSSNNSIGIRLWISLGCGSAFKVTAGAWNNGFGFAATGGVDLISTNGATFYITGVQLEAGSVATPFERRDYGRELMMCQRYLPAWAATAAITEPVASGMADATTSIRISFPFKTSARVKPTGLTVSSNSDFTFYGAGTGAGAVTLGPANTESAVINVATTGATTNSAVIMISAATATAKLLFTGCEL